ncbi:MAG: nucleotidyl transferase AbiEii/AbiGii toxin family protein [Muribaculum sp.]|nr:nucleotidyl transferase AbiEii/AbiGii toxin family protein [Muribaculum sp.]
MLSKEIFTLEYIRELQERYKKDPGLLERVMYAFGLLEALAQVGMKFIFKGGTSLLLLTEHPLRLSTDIDIIVEPETDVEKFVLEASKIFPFKCHEKQIRKGKNKIKKEHYKFIYDSPILKKDFYILLDIVFMENPYATLIERKIQNDVLLTVGEPSKIVMPSADCILGDKMTAFAPHTTGIPIGIGKELEIMKQMYDVATLSEIFMNQQELWETYDRVVMEEIAFRNIAEDRDSVLRDTIRATACIIGRGYTDPEEYPLYVEGAAALDSHILQGKYNREMAAINACQVMYLAACILERKPFKKLDNPKKYISENMSGSRYNKLSYIKKHKLEAYGYLVEAVRILEE